MSEENTLDDFLGDESKEPDEHSIEGAELRLREITDTRSKIYYLENALSWYRKFWIEMGFAPANIMNPDYLKEVFTSPSLFNYPIWVKEEIEALKRKLAYEEQNPPKERHELNYPDFTNSQYVLMFYYLIKYAGIEPRAKGMDIAPFAKFIHIITGKNFTTIQNSDFYKKLSKAPNFKKDKQLIIDLEVVKAQFERVELKEIVKEIDNEIDQARTEIKRGKVEK